jgi:colanic acid/amylovoran biosynthesis glycosyltransferase
MFLNSKARLAVGRDVLRSGSLAIATTVVGKRTETFILNHIRNIAPSKTVLLCFESDGTSIDGIPVQTLEFCSLARRSGVAGRFLRIFSLLKNGCALPLTTKCQKTLCHFLKENNVNVVLAEFGFTGYWLNSIIRKNRIPLFVHFHGVDATADPVYWQSRYSYRSLARAVEGVIVPSRFLAAKVTRLGFPAERIHVVPCGVDTGVFTPTSVEWFSRSIDILAVGRLVEKKSPQTTIRAFGKVLASNPGRELKLKIIGDGPLRPTCEQLVTDLELQNHVEFCGPQEPNFVRRAMQRSDIFVQHSVTAANGDMEGLPVSILEAMACGLPVVATRHSGIPEAVLHEQTGYLVAEHDVEAMAQAVNRLILDRDLRTQFGQAGRQLAVSEFSLDHTIHCLRNILVRNYLPT